jgi:SAM-dependent methyltransferase
VVKEYHSNNILELLPDGQFGVIFSYNYFNYKPLEVIHRYLQEVFEKLRPGGVFIFTFNDCDRAHGAALAERHFMCYTPGRAVQKHAETVGYEILNKHHGEGDLSWFELRKPGDIRSIRGGQSLARIVVNSK